MQRDIWVDFNDVDGGVVTTLSKFAEPGVRLAVGVSLVVGDEDGNLCKAEVVSVDSEGLVQLAVDLGTFQASEAPLAVCV